jgi:hypothetical protein
VYSLKYWGTDRPMKMENPTMNLVLKLLRLQNWRKLRPHAPANMNIEKLEAAMQRKRWTLLRDDSYLDLPTYAKKMQ